MALHLVQALLISIVSYAAWRVLRPFALKSPLDDIPGPPRASWWKGNFGQIFNRQGWQFHHDIVEKYGSVVKIHGLFGNQELYVSDPRALHHIVVKDQYIYEETSAFIANNGVIFGKSLLSTLGDHHRKQRKMLNPVFSLAHMRDLIPVFYPIAHQLRDVLTRQVESGAEEINIMMWMGRAALEYIGQGGLGYSFDALDDTKTNEYHEAIKMFGPTSFGLILPRQFLPYIVKLGTPALRRKLLDWIPSAVLQRVKGIVDTMDKTSAEIYRKKKQALERGEEAVSQQVGRGKDIMSVLLRANSAADEKDRLPDAELLGQMNTFIFAGSDTTTGALSRILYQLSFNPDVQSKLREEVTEARKVHGDLPYDTLMALPYLDAVCRETLRVYPPLSMISRTTRKDVTLPLMYPIKTVGGKEITEIPLKNNTNVIISILAANRSKAIWGEDAEEWRPERWLKPLPGSVAQAHLPGVYASMMTFLGGGRACIGFKFAEMEMKLMLTILLESFAFAPSSKEIYWNMGGLQSPVVKGSNDITPQLPLKMSFIKN